MDVGALKTRRNKRAALKLMRKLLKKYGFVPDKLVTDELRSYAPQPVILESQNATSVVWEWQSTEIIDPQCTSATRPMKLMVSPRNAATLGTSRKT
jgi:transposase-like protein